MSFGEDSAKLSIDNGGENACERRAENSIAAP
jgi:hypothetical protein